MGGRGDALQVGIEDASSEGSGSEPVRVPRVPAVPAVPAAHIGDLHPFIQETLLFSSPPSSFALVNKVSKKFFDAERRYNYTTPTTFLELIKLYKNVLTKKRKATQVCVGGRMTVTTMYITTVPFCYSKATGT